VPGLFFRSSSINIFFSLGCSFVSSKTIRIKSSKLVCRPSTFSMFAINYIPWYVFSPPSALTDMRGKLLVFQNYSVLSVPRVET